MTAAIIQILFLLTVSCLIGVFFTYRYWKSKFSQLKAEKDAQEKTLTNSVESEKARAKSLETDLENCQKGIKKSKSNEATEVATLLEKIELMEEEMQEKERELVYLSMELESKKISYYKQIDGKRYKAITLKMADEAISGQGDGRISMEDAKMIFDTISDGKVYTQVEKDTMRYLRENYKWTDGADELFRKKVRSWAAKGHRLD